MPLSSGSKSKPSTHESGNVMHLMIRDQEVEKEQEEEVDQDIEDPVEPVVEENVDVEEDEGITDYGLDDIKFDPGLRIPIDKFHPNIRNDVIFAYLEKGPTQPTRHNFPTNSDIRSFRPAWYMEFDWLEYGVLYRARDIQKS